MANISCDVGYSTNVLPRDPPSRRRHRTSPIRVPLNDEGGRAPCSRTISPRHDGDDGRVPTTALSSSIRTPRIAAFHEKQRNEKPLIMFRRDAATCHHGLDDAADAAFIDFKKKAHTADEGGFTKKKSSPLVAASLAAVAKHKLQAQKQQRAAGGVGIGRRGHSHNYHHPGNNNRAVLNDHLLWLELQRELRSKNVFTNVAANVVARRYIHELTQGIEGEKHKKANDANKPSAGIDLVDNARFFGLMPPTPRSRASSSSSGLQHDVGTTRRKSNGALGSSLANMFGGGDRSSSLSPSSSVPHSNHSSAGCLSDLLTMSGGEQQDSQAHQAQSMNLKSADDLLASHAAARQAATRKNSGVGWMMKSLGDSLSRESQCDSSMNGNMSNLSSGIFSTSELEEDLLVRASMSTSALSSAAAAASAADQQQQLRGTPTKKKKRKGSLGSLSAGMSYVLDSAAHLTAMHESYCLEELLAKEKGEVSLMTEQELSRFVPGKKPSSSCEEKEDGNDVLAAQGSLGYSSVVRAFETLREEDDVGGSQRSIQTGASTSSHGGQDEEDLLVGFGEKPRPRVRRQSSVIAKTA